MMNNDFLNNEFDTQVDLTPLIDVIFMLLVFFIIAATFIKPTIEVALPEADSASMAKANAQQLLIIVDADSLIHFQGRTVTATDLDLILSQDRDLPLNLHVDRSAPFAAFVTVLDKARQHGRENIAITTLPGKK